LLSEQDSVGRDLSMLNSIHFMITMCAYDSVWRYMNALFEYVTEPCPTQPPCNIKCMYGLKTDKNGCQLCECLKKPPPQK